MSTTPEMGDYLQPDFDPNSLTMPKLRGILVEHAVHYSSTAKKGDLVDLFEANVRPKARQLLSARSKTKRSARGIVDVPSSTEPSLDGHISDEEQPPARTPRGTSRRTTRNNTEEALPVAPSTARRPGRPSASASRMLSEESDANDVNRKLSGNRRTRLSTATPSIKIEEDDEDEMPHARRRQSGFTSENVFQSGSSPIPTIEAPREKSTDRRRRTTGGPATEEKKKTSSRQQPNNVSSRSAIASPRRTRPGDRRVSPSVQSEEDDQEEVEAGEEFTAEEEQELALQEQTQNGAVVRTDRPKQARPKGAIAKVAPLSIVGILLPVFLGFLRQEKLAVGFCGVGRPATSQIGDIQIPAWARENILPSCEPCPSHAYCYADLQVQCEDDFVRSPHPLSLGGLVPLPPSCEPDGEKARKVQAVAQRAVEELRERNAKVECGELKDATTGKKIASAVIPEPELKATVSSKRHRRMSEDEFEELWHSALGDIMARDEVIGDVDSTTTKRNLRSTSLARVPLSCAIRRSVRLALVRYLRELVLSLALLSALYYAYSTFLSWREMEARAKQLAAYAMDTLSNQAAWANYYGDEPGEDGGRVERYVGVALLRDDVLRDEFSASRRNRLWKSVQRIVEQNTNVRPSVREDRSGEVGRVWEWIGAVGALEFGDGMEDGGARPVSAQGVRRRKSQRFSVPPVGAKSRGDEGPGDEVGRTRGLQHWEEGRPVY